MRCLTRKPRKVSRLQNKTMYFQSFPPTDIAWVTSLTTHKYFVINLTFYKFSVTVKFRLDCHPRKPSGSAIEAKTTFAHFCRY